MNKSHAAAAVISIRRLTLSYHLMPAILSARDLKFEYAKYDGNQQNHAREGNHQFANGIYVIGGKDRIGYHGFCGKKGNEMADDRILTGWKKHWCNRAECTDDYGSKGCFADGGKQHGEGHDGKNDNIIDANAV